MHFFLVSVIAGLAGTGGMTLVLWSIDRSGWANADMVRALGSAVTRSVETSLAPGLIIHFAAGIPFAMLYIYALSMLKFTTLLSIMLASGIIGLAHGFAFSFVMVILSEHHPVERYKEAGFEVALAHFVSHIVFGLLVGFITGVTGYLA